MTTGPAIGKLLAIAGPPLLNADVDLDQHMDRGTLVAAGRHSAAITDLLKSRNGFFAFEGALRVYPPRSVPISYGLDEWNGPTLWRSEYSDLASGCFFFAEDAFGGQFCIAENAFWSFDPETGKRLHVAESLEEWASAILEDFEVLTGYKLIHEWQAIHGRLPGRQRLMPRVPFVAGGEFEISNLVAVDAASAMRVRGAIARQIRDLPDGAQIKIEISDY